jgi:non-heme chloroperoxidase
MERGLTVDRAGTPSGGPIATHAVRAGGGISLHVREWGNRDGPSILLIHGWSQSQMCWSYQVHSHLANNFHIVTFDNRGHGMSDKPTQIDRYVSAQLWADDIAAIIEQRRLERPVLVGWSYGGFIISDYLRAYGEQAIAGINLVGGAVMLRPPTFDHLGSGLLANAEDACSSDLDASIPAVLRFLRACTARPLTLEHDRSPGNTKRADLAPDRRR